MSAAIDLHRNSFPMQQVDTAVVLGFAAVVSVLGPVVCLCWYVLGDPSPFLPVCAAIAMFGAGVVTALHWRSDGVVTVDSDGIMFKGPLGRGNIKWQYIVKIERDEPRRRGERGGCIKITLNRSIRSGFGAGPDAIGIPSGFLRSVRLRLQDPEGFLAAVAPYASAQ